MRTLRFFLLGLATTLAGSAPAWGDCSTTCTSYVQGRCVQYTRTCTDQPSSPPAGFGAIAFGPKNQAYGQSHGWGNQAKAEGEALRQCGQHGADCRVIVWFRSQCGAVAVRGDSPAAYWGLGKNAAEARSIALDRCAKDNGQNCDVLTSQCSK